MIRGGLSSDGGIPGIFFSSGLTWVETRRTSLHILRNYGFGKASMEDMIDDEVSIFLQHIDDHWINTAFDVSHLFNVAVLASLWRIISGESLKIGDPKLTDLCEKARAVSVEFGNPLAGIAQYLPSLFVFLNKIGSINILKHMDAINKFCKEAVESVKIQEIDANSPSTFIEAMLYKIQSTDDISSPLYGDAGKLNLVNIIVDFFLAGADTSSSFLNWSMLFMINNPDIQDKVRQELLENVGSTRAKMSDRQSTPYTEAVLLESQRRGNFSDFTLFHKSTTSLNIGEFKIPSKTVIVPMIGEIMHDPEQFPRPMDFSPNRYLGKNDDGTKKFIPHPHVIPFGIGKRRCPGENLAKTTMYKFFTAIVQKYKIVSGQDEFISEATAGGIVPAPKPYKLKFVKL